MQIARASQVIPLQIAPMHATCTRIKGIADGYTISSPFAIASNLIVDFVSDCQAAGSANTTAAIGAYLPRSVSLIPPIMRTLPAALSALPSLSNFGIAGYLARNLFHFAFGLLRRAFIRSLSIYTFLFCASGDLTVWMKMSFTMPDPNIFFVEGASRVSASALCKTAQSSTARSAKFDLGLKGHSPHPGPVW